MENSTQNNKNKKLTLFDILLMIILLPFYLLFSKKTRKVTWILIVIVLLIISFINIKNPKKQEQKALEQQLPWCLVPSRRPPAWLERVG